MAMRDAVIEVYTLYLQTSPFATPFLSVLKVLSLAAGGQVNSVFRFSNMGSGEQEPVPYPGLAYLFWILFIAFIAILFLNFLVSCTQRDVPYKHY